MKLDELISQLQTIREECNYNAHPYGKDSEVSVWWMRDKEHDNEVFDIVEVEAERAPGCGCWVGAEIIIGKKGNQL